MYFFLDYGRINSDNKQLYFGFSDLLENHTTVVFVFSGLKRYLYMNDNKLNALCSAYSRLKTKAAVFDENVSLVWTNDNEIFSSVRNECFYTPAISVLGKIGKTGIKDIAEESTVLMISGDSVFSVRVIPIFEGNTLEGFIVETNDFFDFLSKMNSSYGSVAINKYLSLAREVSASVAFTGEQLRESLEKIEEYDLAGKTKELSKSTYKMLAAVANIEEMLKYASKNFNVTTFSLSDYTENVLHSVIPKLSADGVKLKFQIDNDITVKLDGERYLSVLLNLISNGVMYNISEQKEINVRLSSLGDNAVLSVTDNGTGLSGKAQKLMNVAFAMSDISKGNESLGFEIVRLFCKEFSSSFSYMTKENEGTTVTLQIPMEKNEEKLKAPVTDYLFRKYSPIDIYLYKTKI